MKHTRHGGARGAVEGTNRPFPRLVLARGSWARRWKWGGVRWKLAVILGTACILAVASTELAGREWAATGDEFSISAHQLEALVQEPPPLPLDAIEAAVASRIAESSARLAAETERDVLAGARFTARAALRDTELTGSALQDEAVRTEPLELAPLPELEALRAQLRSAIR